MRVNVTAIFSLMLILLVGVAQAEVLDKIVATVGCGTSKIVITQRDIKLPDVTNNMKPFSLEDLIEQSVLLLEAQRFRIANFSIDVSVSEVDAYVERVKNLLGVTGSSDAAFKAKLEGYGLSVFDIREQIYRSRMVQKLLSFVFPNKYAVSPLSIERYYNENPEIVPAKVHLMATEISSKKLRILKDQCISSDGTLDFDKLASKLDFCDLGFVAVNDLDASTREIVEGMQIGQIHVPDLDVCDEKNANVRVLKLVAKQEQRLKTLDERRDEISELIQEQEREEKYKNYVKELQEHSYVRVFE